MTHIADSSRRLRHARPRPGTGAALLLALLMLLVVAGTAPSLAAAADSTPPQGTASLPAFVTTWDVVVTLDFGDAESGVTDARLSNDGLAWAAWTPLPAPEPYALDVHVELPWALSPAVGAKTVYVQVRNGEGLVADLQASTRVVLATNLVLRAVPPVVVYGTEAEVRGVLMLGDVAAPAGTAAAVSRRRVDEADFTVVDTVTTDAAGRFARPPGPAWRQRRTGSPTPATTRTAPATSDRDRRSRVRPKLSSRRAVHEVVQGLGDAVRLARPRRRPPTRARTVTIERKVSAASGGTSAHVPPSRTKSTLLERAGSRPRPGYLALPR